MSRPKATKTMLLAIAALATAGAASASAILFTDFSSSAGLNFAGSAQQAGNVLRLTPASPFQAGAAWFAQQQPVGTGFETIFDFRITPSGQPADGLVFLVQNYSPVTLGPAGGALGYWSLPNSLAIEFDTYMNVPPLTNYNDPNANHIAIQSCGPAPNTPDHLAGCTLALQPALSATLADGAAHTARITYIPGTLSVFLDGSQALQAPVDLSTLLSLNNGSAWVGFTGATGGSMETNDLLSWSFEQNTPEPGTWALCGSALLGLAFALRRRS